MVFLPADYIRRYNIPKYPEIPIGFSSLPDDSCPFSDDLSIQDRNPDRGFRGELYLTLGREEAYPLSGKNALQFFDECYRKHSADNIRHFQLYVYLCEYYKKPLDADALRQLKSYFHMLRQHHVRVLLRFAYETESSHTCPSTRLMSENIRILKRWFSENNSLVNSVVYGAQLGMIGYWGEGHSETHPCDKKKIIPEIVDMFPKHLTVMVRKPHFFKFIPINLLKRCSIHDDFLVGNEHPWGMIPYSHKQYPMLLNMNRHSLCDGEMPWGRDKTVAVIDPIRFVCQCVGYGFGTLSAEHNYKEDEHSYCLEQWKNVMLTEQLLIEKNLPYFPASLKDGMISVFHYLKYHLGYLLAISNIEKNDESITFTLYNFGMGIPSDFSIEYKLNDETIYEDISCLTAFSAKTFTVGKDSAFRIAHNADPSLFITPLNGVAIDEHGYIKL